MKNATHSWMLICLVTLGVARAETAVMKPENKLMQMYRLYYLPYQVDFKEGRTPNDIFPLAPDRKGDYTQLIQPEDLHSLDKSYGRIRDLWKKKSLFLTTPLSEKESTRITPRLVSHRIGLNRGPWEGLSVTDRVTLNQLLAGKSEAIQKSVTQVQFLRSFLKPLEDQKFNFFIIGPSWCDSSREYRVILEQYFKQFSPQGAILHSVVIDDPKEEVFDSKLLTDLFPHPEKYSHDSVPRFLALEVKNGVPVIHEEGDAVRELVDRFFGDAKGFLAEPTSRRVRRDTASNPGQALLARP